MMPRVVKFAPLSKHGLHFEFDDGVSGTINLSGEIDGEVFQPIIGGSVVFVSSWLTANRNSRISAATKLRERPPAFFKTGRGHA